MSPLTSAVLAAEPSNVVEWLTDRAARDSRGAIGSEAWTTVWHSAVALLVVVAVAVPLAAALAHFRRGELAAAFAVSLGRAIPTVTIVGMLAIASVRNGFGLEPWPIIIALVLLGLPPVFANAYAAVRNVDPDPVSAARAMGSTHRQVLWQVELPLALPVVLAGIRTAAVQILATEPLGAFFGGEGLGRDLRQGLASRDAYEVQAGALLVTAVAVAAELAIVLAARLAVPAGVRQAAGRTRRAGRAAAPPELVTLNP